MLINKKIKDELIKEKYLEMKSLGKTEDVLNEKFGQLMIFINKKPKLFLFNLEINDDIIYVGSN